MADSSPLERITARHNDRIDAVVSWFEERLTPIVNRAQMATMSRLQDKLSVTDGVLDATPANQAALRSVDKLFLEEMARAGYPELVDSYVKSFHGQFDFLEETLRALDVPPPKFSGADRKAFAAQMLNAGDNLDGVVSTAAEAAKRQALFSVGGLKLDELAGVLAAQFGRTLPQAVTLADTSQTVFYRTIADRGYQKIEEDQPVGSVRYRYYGPDDKLTRRFCQRLVESGKSYTRDQIERMNNGQLPNVFLTGGGYNCRHQWAIALGDTRPAGARDRRPPEEVRQELRLTQRIHEAAVRGQKAQVRELTRVAQSGEPGDLRRLSQAHAELVGIQRTMRDKLWDVMAAEAPARPEAVLDRAPAGLARSWNRGLEFFNRMAGQGHGIDGKPVVFLRDSFSGRAGYVAGEVHSPDNMLPHEVAHELGHWLEENDADVHALAADFLERRTAGQKPVRMSEATGNAGYPAREKTRPDKFLDPYIGKVSRKGRDGRQEMTEVVSMGLEMLYQKPLRVIRDPDFFDLLWKALRRRP